ncbi:polysaccharide deacetylase family protein [Candidatus Woesearchaeota archaeon]|nr:polysaccharide deacetylase family protein [Candidatus Woesearchaeota archaeon]
MKTTDYLTFLKSVQNKLEQIGKEVSNFQEGLKIGGGKAKEHEEDLVRKLKECIAIKAEININYAACIKTDNVKSQTLDALEHIRVVGEKIIKAHEKLIGEIVNVPVLMYHNISEENNPKSRYTVSKKKFEQQMEWLKKQGYQPITFIELQQYLKGEILLRKPVIITFDDGFVNLNLVRAIMAQYNFRAVISIVTKRVGEPVFINKTDCESTLDLAQLRQFSREGWQIISHSHDLHHLGESDINTLFKTKSREEFLALMEADLKKSKGYLDTHFPDQNNEVLAWPFNFYQRDVVKIAEKVGFKVMLTTDVHNVNSIFALVKRDQWAALISLRHLFSSFIHRFTDPRYISRIEISNQVDLDEFSKRITGANYMFKIKVINKFKQLIERAMKTLRLQPA